VQVETLKMLGKDPEQATYVRDGATGDSSDPRGWDGAALLAGEEIRRMLTHASSTKSRMGGIELGQVASRDALMADVTGTTNMRRGDYAGLGPAAAPAPAVLDLIPTGTMDNNSLPYTQESGSFATAAETTEGSAKPEAAITFTDATADAVTIAHWLKIRKQALADFAGPAVDHRRPPALRRRAAPRGQVIAGDGRREPARHPEHVGDRRGRLRRRRARRRPGAAGDHDGPARRREADGIVMHPTDWQTALLAKAAGDGHYYSGGPFSGHPAGDVGRPADPVRRAPAGDRARRRLRDRRAAVHPRGRQRPAVRQRPGRLHQEPVTLLAEMRAALAVFRPAAFATVDLTP
jgi:hypothetical protein